MNLEDLRFLERQNKDCVLMSILHSKSRMDYLYLCTVDTHLCCSLVSVSHSPNICLFILNDFFFKPPVHKITDHVKLFS